MKTLAADHEPYEVVAWRDGAPLLLDQTVLPGELEYRRIERLDDGIEAIRAMRVRGAPAIGVAAAYTLALAARTLPASDLAGAAEALAAARPTAVNLRWAVERVLGVASRSADPAAAALAEARTIQEEQRASDLALARAGAELLPEGANTVITHCNTGALATAGGLGTALGVIITAHRHGRIERVLVDETRPRLQGARLTSWELSQHGVPHRVIADGAAASLLAQGGVTAAFVGADRIAANGDTANKIGTFGLAVVCRHLGVPFYVVAPRSTVDLGLASGNEIPIEQRDEDEVLAPAGHRLAAPAARALNPAFDVTPAGLITAIVLDDGVIRAPFGPALAARRPAGAGIG